MKLTDEEKRMYHGESGSIVAKAMDYLVKFGEACDADSMVDIGYAHVYPGSPLFHRDLEEVLELAAGGARVVVPTTTNAIPTDIEQWQVIGAPEEFARRQISVVPAHKKMGIAGTYTCTPYLVGYLPPKGTHLASMETSAVIYFNSMLGARSNRDSLFIIYAALTGKYPACGYHLDENRIGTHLIHVETKLTNTTEYSALGFCIGEIVGGGVPIITGLVSPQLEELIAMGSAIATSGEAALFHIPGITAECPTLDSTFTKGTSYNESSIDDKGIRRIYEKFYTAKSDIVDFVFLGCPHYTLEQIRQVAILLQGHKIQKDVKFWVCTSRSNKAVADLTGYSEVIEAA
ncbi:aconitase X, partial [Chloroflexota bacterium]